VVVTPGNSSIGFQNEYNRHIQLTIRREEDVYGAFLIFDTINHGWWLLNRGSTEEGPNTIGVEAATQFGRDDDVFMVMDTQRNTGTYFFDVYTNTWYHPVASTPFVGHEGDYALVYDIAHKKWVKYASGWQTRELWTYSTGDSNWTHEGGWKSTTTSATLTTGDNHVHVTDTTGAVAGGSIWVKTRPGLAACADDCGECYAYWTAPITSVSGDAIYFSGPTDFCGSPVPTGTAVQIYPVGWPPMSLGSNWGAGLGVDGVYDDINNKLLFFVPINTQPYVYGSGSGDIQVWTYNLDTHAWTQKTGAGAILAHRQADMPAAWMHKNNAVIFADSCQTRPEGAPLGVGTTIRYYRYANGSVVIEAPTNLAASVDTDHITLTWDAVSGATGYYVYRESGANVWGHAWTTKINSGNLVNGTTFADSTVLDGTTYYYRVSAYNGSVESMLSLIARGKPKLIWDGYVSVPDTTHETVHWVPRDTNVTSYKVYRSLCTVVEYPKDGSYSASDYAYTTDVVKTAKPGTWRLIATCPGDAGCSGNSYADTADLRGGSPYPYKVYAYRVTSINELGIESGPSPFWLTIPRSTRHLNWKEVANGSNWDIKLKWDANPETGIQGYHIYRLVKGEDHVTRVTSSPVNATCYTHVNGVAGRTRNVMYYVVPMDGLGQEGIPSARAWTRRDCATTWTSQGYLQDYNSGIE
jgi:hypothetical protein